MRAHQRRLREFVEKMIDICRERGITSYDLRQPVHDSLTYGMHTDDPGYEDMWILADEISRAGLAAQLAHLREAWGKSKTERHLMNTGGVLDAIRVHVSSTEQELRDDIGLHNIDLDGDVDD